LDDLLRSFWRKSHPNGQPESLALLSVIEFPEETSARKIAGYHQPKIQFFRKAYKSASEDFIKQWISNPSYTADQLLVQADNNLNTEFDPKANQRIQIPHHITSYDSNQISMTVENNSNGPIWLYYADVWHPNWRAFNNNKLIPISKANIAYKAIKLPQGTNHVQFAYSSKVFLRAAQLLSFNALLWCIYFFFLGGNIGREH